MKCEHCKVNRATINMLIQFNDEKERMNICSECLEDIQERIANPNEPFFNMPNMKNMFSQGFFQGGMPFGSGPDVAKSRTKSKEGQAERVGLIDHLGNNVTHAARNGEIDPVIGRDSEVKRVIET